MIKYIFSIFIFISLLSSNSLDIKELQKSFYDEVIVVNIYKKYFNTYLEMSCINDDIQCYKDSILNISAWGTTQNNNKLQNELLNRKDKISLNKKYFNKIIEKIEEKIENKIFFYSQFVSVVDLERQLLIVLFYEDKDDKFYFIGSDLISAGDINREGEVKKGQDHYLKTPIGLYQIKKGWRSEGKYSIDNETLAYGSKGRFIYYLGKHKTIRYNTFTQDGEKMYDKEDWNLISDTLNLAIHSHKSTAKMGKAYSHGCVRMTNELNCFLDNQLILHKNFLKNGDWKLKFAKEPNSLKNKNIAGEYLIIFDKI